MVIWISQNRANKVKIWLEFAKLLMVSLLKAIKMEQLDGIGNLSKFCPSPSHDVERIIQAHVTADARTLR